MSRRKFRIQIAPSAVGERIAEVRGQRTQEKFAELLGISQPTLNRYENGQVPHARHLLAIAALDPLRRGVEWLLTGEQGNLYKEAAGGEGMLGEREGPWVSDPRRMQLVREIKELVKDAPDGVIDALLRNVEWFKKVPKEE